jgi:hypothetical protein
MRRTITILLAISATALAAAMAGVSSWQRADGMLERILWSWLALTAVTVVHFLPALMRQALVVWPVWTIGFCFLLYSHFSFFFTTGQRAVEVRSAQSEHARGVRDKRSLIEAELATIKARPAATVAAQLARASTPERVQALQIELDEARRVAKLREKLFSLADEATVTAITDPVAARLAAVTGVTPAAIGTLVNVIGALLVEVVGMLLWREVLRREKNAPETGVDAREDLQISVAQPSTEMPDLYRLRRAIERGECKATVAGIRVYLGCGTERAMKLSRELKPRNAA